MENNFNHRPRLYRFGRFFLVLITLAAFATAASGCGGGGGGSAASSTVITTPGTNPGLSFTSPASATQMSDVDFRAETFYIEIKHTAALRSGSLVVNFSMDGGTPTNIASYFSEYNSTTLRTNSQFYNFTRSLFDLATNDSTRRMTVNASANSSDGGSGSATPLYFEVLPAAAPPPPLSP